MCVLLLRNDRSKQQGATQLIRISTRSRVRSLMGFLDYASGAGKTFISSIVSQDHHPNLGLRRGPG